MTRVARASASALALSLAAARRGAGAADLRRGAGGAPPVRPDAARPPRRRRCRRVRVDNDGAPRCRGCRSPRCRRRCCTAIVLSEDRRFYEHGGVDWRAAARSAWGNLWNTRTRGASTLTMQLAGLLDDGLARPAGGRSVGAEARPGGDRARGSSARWKKSEILEAYLNAVPFRGELVGIDALRADAVRQARRAGSTRTRRRSPRRWCARPNATPAAVARARLRRAARCSGSTAPASPALDRRRRWRGAAAWPLGEQLAPHFARLARRPARRRPRSASTLDAGAAALRASQTLRRQLAELPAATSKTAPCVVLDNASGEVLAWVGSQRRAVAARPRSTACWRGASRARRSSPSSTRWPSSSG